MKKLFFVSLLVFVVLLAGCTQEPDKPEIIETSEFNVLVYEEGVNLEDGTLKFKLDDAVVKVKDDTKRTDEQGIVTFPDLRYGKYDLSILKEGYNNFEETLVLDSEELNISIDLEQTGSPVLNPEVVEFNIQDPQDVTTGITWNDATSVTGIYRIVGDSDFEIVSIDSNDIKGNSTLVIDKNYVLNLSDKYTQLMFYVKFDVGSDQLLTVNIIDEPVQTDPQLSPTEVDFDLSNPQDLEFGITWNSATQITSIELGMKGGFYEVLEFDNILKVSANRILEEGVIAGDVLEMTVNFDVGAPVVVTINIVETAIAEVNIVGDFVINHAKQGSVVESGVNAWSVKSENPDEYIVRYSKNENVAEVVKKLKDSGHEVLDTLEELRAVLVSKNSTKLSLQSLDFVTDVSENTIFTTNTDYITPNDELYSSKWSPSPLRLPQTWVQVKGDTSVRVAVIDTGIDHTHEDLAGIVRDDLGYNFVTDVPNGMDDYGHGTHVSGIISAITNNSIGVSGVMWESELIPVKVLDSSGSGSEWSVAQGILYASGLLADLPIERADVINMSLGAHVYTPPELMQDAVQQASNAGVILVASAGNSGTNDVGYPAAFPEVIAVSALEPDITLASYSSYGSEVAFAAPGSFVLSTVLNNSYGNHSGTSMASPHVAGAVGLLLANGTPASEVLNVLKNTAIDLGAEGKDEYYGYGMPNVYWAINEVSTINVIARNGTNIITQKEIGLGIRNFELLNLPTGEYEIVLWIDVKGNGIQENGDYFATTGIQNFTGGNYSFSMELTEFMQQ